MKQKGRNVETVYFPEVMMRRKTLLHVPGAFVMPFRLFIYKHFGT